MAGIEAEKYEKPSEAKQVASNKFIAGNRYDQNFTGAMDILRFREEKVCSHFCAEHFIAKCYRE